MASTDEGLLTEQERFRFTVRDNFDLAGRGTVVTGDVDAGTVRVGDLVDLRHAGHTVRTQVGGVELGHGRRPSGDTFEFVGLLLAGVSPFKVVSGDHVVSVGPRPDDRGSEVLDT